MYVVMYAIWRSRTGTQSWPHRCSLHLDVEMYAVKLLGKLKSMVRVTCSGLAYYLVVYVFLYLQSASDLISYIALFTLNWITKKNEEKKHTYVYGLGHHKTPKLEI